MKEQALSEDAFRNTEPARPDRPPSQDAETQVVDTARVGSGSMWHGVLLLVVVACLGLLTWNAIQLHRNGGTGLDLISPFGSLIQACVPAKLGSLAEKAALIYLSPWLYLLMAGVFLAEKVIPADRDQPIISVGMVQDFFGWFVLGNLVRVALLGGFMAGLYWFSDRFLSGLRIEAVAAWHTAAAAALAILVGDLLNWFHHFIRHKIGVFWLFHTIHHSQKQMNMFTDLRVHLVEYMIAKPITVFPLFVLGLDFELAFWLTLILESYSRVYHANLRTNYGPLRYVLVTPQSHRIHHSDRPEHMDKNFAVLFSFWDHLFGTQWENYDEYPTTGIDDASFPHEQRLGGVSIVTTYLRQLVGGVAFRRGC